MAKTFSRLLATFAAMAAASTSLAQVPKEGAVDTTICWGGPTHIITATPTDRFGTYVVTGGTRAADKTFDSMSLECIGTFEARSGGSQHKGYCVYQDASGDKFHGTDSFTPQGYAWEFLGGTGKFQGISGTGKVERLGAMPSVRQGTMQGCRRLVGNYKLP